jgi:hypothetical protein
MSYTKNRVQQGSTGIQSKNIEAGTAIIIDEYLPASHSLKVRKLSDGKPLIENRDTTEEIIRSKGYEKTNNKVLKTLPAPDAPIVEVGDDQASMRGSSNNGFYSYRDFGNVITGPTSFSAQPHEIRMSGIMTFHPLLLSGFPSTIVTPIPTLQWSLPTGSMLAPIVKDAALIATLLGAV